MKVVTPKTIHSFGATLAIALAYWSFSSFGHLLNAPPVYASAVWPPAGIALGAVLIWGRRALPGIVLGAYLGNGQFFLFNSASLSQFLLPAGIALGAMLQAAGVAAMIRRWARFPSLLNDPMNMARFLVLAGPLGCCLNASLGNALLIVGGSTPASDLAINWMTWWVGDTLGALIFTPLMLIAFGQPRSVWSPRWLTVALPLLISFAMATSIFAYVRDADNQRKRREFVNLADVANHSIESGLQGFTVILSAMKGLFDSSEEVNCSEIKTFTDILLERKGGFQALEWAKRVRQGERTAFEQGHVLCDNSVSGITERSALGSMVPAGDREEYLPVVFVDPFAPNRIALGYDLLSERLRRETIVLSRDSGSFQLTPPIILVQEPGQFNVLMVTPLYRHGVDAASQEGRKHNFTGIAFGVLRVKGLVNTALEKLGGQRTVVHVQVQDENVPGGNGVLFSDDGFSTNSLLFQQRRIKIGGRVWLVSVSGSLSDFGQSWFTWFVLASGTLFSGVLGGFLLLMTGKTLNMEALIAKRTLDLSESNKRLREEIGERTKTEIELKANERAIQKLNRSYQDLLAAASEVSIIATDPKGLITLFNRGAERMLGYSAGDLVGIKSPGMFHLSAEIEARGRELSKELGFPVEGFDVFTAIPDICGQEIHEWTYVCKDGLSIWVSLVVTQIKSEEGETTGYLGIAQNITERRAAEQSLQKAKLAADKANQAKSEFLANMSHEIRTPMNGVLGMIELLRGTSLSSGQRELVDTACQSANALMDIINDILDFSKIEAGKFFLDSLEFNVAELCESVCSLLAVPAQAKGLEFNCYVQPDMQAEVRGDSARLRQILVNLIGNAVKFTLQGEVSVEAQCIYEDDLNLYIRFSVKDTGIGMRAEELNRLFMPFEQAEHGTTRRFGGTGLGLSISKSLVELMGGEIGVESKQNFGSTFWFSVKLEKAPTIKPVHETLNLAGHHVLVADDNKTNLDILENFLNSWGVLVSTSDNGGEALEMLKAASQQGKPYDLAILDQVMPELGGLEVIRAIADTPGIDGTPCILLCSTGNIGEPIVKSDRIVSLSKPVRQSQLFDALASSVLCGVKQPVEIKTETQVVFPKFEGKRLLLVEDNLINQRVALKMLERFGLSARLANDGAEALSELEHNEFDLVFMDCQIPIMDGYSVTKLHRERELRLGLPRTPILALTANAIQGDRDKSLASGMDDHLTKPLSFHELEQALARWLREADNSNSAELKLEETMSEPAWDYQATLEAACGDLELLEELKVLFIEESAKLIESFGTRDAPQSASVIAASAHTMKGMAAHFHAQAVVNLSAEVEKIARTGAIDSTDPLIYRLKHEIDRLVNELRGDG